ncbi:MAG TPA: TldD/PmbA family protein, partial [Thermoprotei archaeon]|nr:TldD/PmbA family protein [Thermoprotei archaeon]
TNGRIERIQHGISGGIGVRLLANGAFSFITINQFDLNKIYRAIDDGISTARLLGSRRREKIGLAEVKPIKDEVKYKALENPAYIDIEEKKRIVEKLYKIASQIDERIVNITIFLLDSVREKVLANTDGTFIKFYIPRVRIGLNAVAMFKGKMGSYMRFEGYVSGYESIYGMNFEKYSKTIISKALKMLEAEPAPSGRFTVITDPDLTGVFSHEAVGHACEGDLVVSGESILAGKLNKRVGSELVNIYDDSTYPDGWGSLKYDDEGVPTQKRLLIEKGILKKYITNRETAVKLGLEPNGGARAQDYSHPPIVRMSNTYMAPGDWSFEEIIEDIKYGVYLLGSRGGQVDTAKGTFQFNAQEAFLIENGEITKPLLDVSLSGLTLETLMNIDALSKDFTLRTGTCGKGGQGVPAGTGGPHARIKNAVVGGRR